MPFSDRARKAAAAILAREGEAATVYRGDGFSVDARAFVTKTLRGDGDFDAQPEYVDMAYFDREVYTPLRGDQFSTSDGRWEIVGVISDGDMYIAGARIRRLY